MENKNETLRGLFIVIEGLDASGKDTQAALLANHLNAQLGFAPTREGELQKIIRNSLKIKDNSKLSGSPLENYLTCLMHADRIYQTYNTENGILKFLNEGKNYVSVRYSLSSEVYNLKDVQASQDLIKPDLTIFLDIDPELSIKRIQSRFEKNGTEIEKYENLEKLKDTREKYLAKLKNIESLIIDADDSIENIQEIIKNHIQVRFGNWLSKLS